MNSTHLRQTQFDVVPLKNVVGVGNTTAYQICVSRGPILATKGSLEKFITDSPMKASRYDDNQPEPASEAQRRSWFRRVINR